MRDCTSCSHFIRLTDRERTRLSLLARDEPYLGACDFRAQGEEHLIRTYLTQPVTGCPAWDRGYFAEQLPMKCPVCRRGFVVIERFGGGQGARIGIRCSRHLTCTLSRNRIEPIGVCTVCGGKLQLRVGSEMILVCVACHRQLQVSLMVKSWPRLYRQLGRTEARCPHGRPAITCSDCRKSEAQGKSLVEIGLAKDLARPLPGQHRPKPATGRQRKSAVSPTPARPRRRKIHRKGYGAIPSFERCEHNVPKWDICAICDPKGFRFWYRCD